MAKYDAEQAAGGLRAAFEARVLGWPGVQAKKMFGYPCYDAGDKLFAFLVTGGVVLTQLSGACAATLREQHDTSLFTANGRTMRSWITIPVRDVADLDVLMPYVQESYEAALRKAAVRD